MHEVSTVIADAPPTTTLDPELAVDGLLLEIAFHALHDAEPNEKTRTQLQRGYDALQRDYDVTGHGELSIGGSNDGDRYWVTSSVCVKHSAPKATKRGGVRYPTCQGWIRSGGGCYHTYAYAILAEAQRLVSDD